MTDYEVTYILRPSLEENEVEERANAIAEIVKGQGGEVTAVERLGKKRLAYEIKDAREGNYVVMQFKGGPSRLQGARPPAQTARGRVAGAYRSARCEDADPYGGAGCRRSAAAAERILFITSVPHW